MIARSTAHATFSIERRFSAPVARVFRAWSNADKKRRWFSCHDDWRTLEYQLDFRVGGAETSTTVRPDGVEHGFGARFLDIVVDQRIVYSYEMRVGEERISVSLVTVVFEDDAGKTKMTFTEQVVFLDGHGDLEERREGTALGLERIEAELSD